MEEALIDYLLAQSDITALAGDRITFVSRPQGERIPAIVLSRIAGAPVYTDNGEEAQLESAELQADCWADSYSEARHLARSVRKALSGFNGTIGASPPVEIQNTLIEADREYREQGTGSAEYLYRVQLDLTVWWRSV